jgi:hypothetical protein
MDYPPAPRIASGPGGGPTQTCRDTPSRKTFVAGRRVDADLDILQICPVPGAEGQVTGWVYI